MIPTRRRFAHAALAVLALAAMSARAWGAGAVTASSRIVLIYVGAPDCPYCRRWEAEEGGRGEVRRLPARAAVEFREIRLESLRTRLEEKHYPPDLAFLFRQFGVLRGVPRFFVLLDGRLVDHGFGLRHWDETTLPLLRDLARDKLAAG